MTTLSTTTSKAALKQLEPLSRVCSFSEATGIHERAVRRALNEGKLPGVRLGRVWYVRTAAALALLGLSE